MPEQGVLVPMVALGADEVGSTRIGFPAIHHATVEVECDRGGDADQDAACSPQNSDA